LVKVRTTVHLEESLAARVHELVPPRGLNRFINQAVAEKVAAIERQKIEEEMKEGYLATNADRDQMMADWEVVDLENWPEWHE
jgi:hypothetical protein